MHKIILSAAMAAALAGAGGAAFAQSAECQQRLPDGRSVCDAPNPGGRAAPQNHGTLMGGVLPAFGDGEREYRRDDRGRVFSGGWFGSDQDEYRRNRNDHNDRDRDGIRNSRDRDRDGDGVPNNRDSHPDNPRRR